MKSHINLHVVAFFAAMMALGAQAIEVSPEQVQAAVSAWSSANGAAFAGLGEAEAPVAVTGDDGAVLYWIVPMSKGGAVVASPDTDLDLVVAVIESYDGAFPEGHPLPSILKRDMGNRLAVLKRRSASFAPVPRLRATAGASATDGEADAALEGAITAANAQWSKYGVGAAGPIRLKAAMLDGGDDSPFVRRVVDGFEKGGRFTHWNQSGGVYNYHTPNNEVCGCVATAASAILQFFSCTNDPGTVKSVAEGGCSLYGHAYDCSTMAGATDWAALPEFGESGWSRSLTADDRSLLGQVTYNMGVLVGMMWARKGPGGESGAYVSNIPAALKAYGFKAARHVSFNSSATGSLAQYMKTVYAQNWSGAPVVLGISGEPGGHAVVGCGYARDPDGDEFCRVFMGWGGSGDAWYRFPKVESFSVVDEAVTMIGYEDDAVVPVYGETNMPGAEFVLRGYVTNGVEVTLTANEYGYFGIRVPYELADKTLFCPARGKSVDIVPFDSAVLANESADRATLDAAIPEEIYFPLLNMTLKRTMESGKSVAMRDGKALLILCGTTGTDRFKLLTDYLYDLDDVSDLSNRFVFVTTSPKSANPNEPDGDPSIGVFDPADFLADERWKQSNGVLDYENFIDYDASGETNEIVYIYSDTDTTTLTNRLDELLSVGYDQYLRRHSGISVNIGGAILADFALGTMSYMYSSGEAQFTNTCISTVVANSWTNGENAVFKAFGTVTNEDAGVIYSCVGWTTNEVQSAEDITNYTAGAEASIQLFANDNITLTWVWDASHYRVRATSVNTPSSAGTVVSPTNAWVAAGERATITAQPKAGARSHFGQWSVNGTVDYTQDPRAMLSGDRSTSISFTVFEPVSVTALYENGAEGAPSSISYTLTFVSSPAVLADEAPLPVAGSFAWGENETFDDVFKVREGATYTDSTGGVWTCTSVRFSPSAYNLGDGFYRISRSPLVVTLEWTLQGSSEDPNPPTPPPTPPTPAEITITGIEQAAGGTWTITVSGAVKDCWYWLYATDDLSKVSGTADGWTASVVKKQQAADESGIVVFSGVADGTGRLFWRARATSTEDGE